MIYSIFQRKSSLLIAALIGLGLAFVSTWRLVDIWQIYVVSPGVWLLTWLVFSIGLTFFWLVTLASLCRLRPALSGSQQWLALNGAVILALAGVLFITPAGFSRITLALQARDVWSPNIFTLTWTDRGIWEVPLTLAVEQARTSVLEIAGATTAGEIWLVEARRADGSHLALDEFAAEAGWTLQAIEWGAYRDQAIWVSPQGQGTLRWQGVVTGPLTLVFAKHERAGPVGVRWNGQAQILNLQASEIEFEGITLPLDGPVVWQAALPWSALGKEMSLSIQPDPTGDLPVIDRISLTGLPGQEVTAAGAEAGQALQTSATVSKLQWSDSEWDGPRTAYLTGPLTPKPGWTPWIPRLEILLVVLYLAVIGAIAGAGLGRWLPARVIPNLNLFVTGFLSALVLGELALQFYLPPANRYYVWPSNLHAVFNPYPGVLPGIEGESHFITNSQGIRGDELPATAIYRILTIGGSTTEVLYLDQTEAWPQLVQTRLNQARPNRPVWVGNVGRGGHTSREHLVQMNYLLAQYPYLDTVIVLMGVNDFMLRLSLDEAYTPDYLSVPGMRRLLLNRAFMILPDQHPDLQPIYRHSGVWRLLARIWQVQAQTAGVAERDIQDNVAKNVIDKRAARQKAAIQEALPDLATSLAEYRGNINAMIDLAQTYQVRLIFLTQPSLWRADLSQAEQALLWHGRKSDGDTYYSIGALAEGMAAYNQTLLEVCRQRRVECVDLATVLPKDTTIFYDDVHFNENGSNRVATIVTDYLLQREPLAGR